MTMLASVLIPTYRRPDDLRRCLSGLAAGSRKADQVIVVHRPDDHASAAVVAEFDGLPLTRLLITEPGQIAAINCGLDGVDGDFVAFIDDDAIPHHDWLERIERWYRENPTVGGVCGRDVVHKGTLIHHAAVEMVGMISWYGRMIGNHHIGLGDSRAVHVMKGANMSFRTLALGAIRGDRRLRGSGAQVHNEVGLCASVRRSGWTLIYDPQVLVDHFPAVRHDEDARSGYSDLAQQNAAHNEQLAVLDALPWWGGLSFGIWSFLVGTAEVPGLVQIPRLVAKRDPLAIPKFKASWRGRAAGVKTWWHSRQRSHA